MASLRPSPFHRPRFGRAHPSERRFGVALLCSGVLHAIVIASAARYLAAMPAVGPHAHGASAPLVAVLQAPMAEIPAVDLLPLPPLPPELTTPSIPEPAPASAPTPSSAPAAPLTNPAYGISPVDLPITAADPNGRISYGLVGNPAKLGRGVARRLQDRYPVSPYKRPNVQGSLTLGYPAAAQQTHTSARIAAVLDLDTQGTITAVTLVPREDVFGPAVLAALKDVRMSPAETPAGRVPYWAIVEFVFTIAPASLADAPDAKPPGAR